MASRWSLLAAAICAALICASPAEPTCEGPFRVSSLPPYAFIDACGRQRTWRGFNQVVKEAPWIVPRAFAPGGGSLAPADTALWRSLGANVVRLGVMWSGIVPSARGVVDTALADAYAALSAAIYAEAGIVTIADAHQDGFSPFFCDDGAPSWAAREYSAGAEGFPWPAGAPYNVSNATGNYDCTGSTIPWAEYYFTAAVGRAFKTLYNTTRGQSDFGAFWGAIIAAYARAPDRGAGLLMLELINEPWAGDALADPLLLVPGVADAVSLAPFYTAVSSLIRAAEDAAGVDHHILAMEPMTFDEVAPAGFARGGAWQDGLSALSYHYYNLPDFIGVELQVAARAADALRLGAGGFLTEYDLDLLHPVLGPYTALDLRATLAACDAVGHSYTGWVYGSLFDDGDPSGTTLYVPAVREMARPLPWAVAGTNATWAFSAASADAPALGFNYTHLAAVGGPTRVFLSTGLWFPAATLAVRVDSVPPGAVTWALEHHDGTVSLPAANASRVAMAPFAWAELVVSTVPGVAAAARVAVTVTVTA